MLSLPNNRASYLINEGKSVQKLVHRTISNFTYLLNMFYNIHSTSIQITDPPASAGNCAGEVKKKKKKKQNKRKRLGQRYLPVLLLSQSLHGHFNL